MTAADALWRKAPELVLAAGFGAFAVLAIVLIWPHPTPLPPAEQTTVDSLAATEPAYRQHVDTLIRVDSEAVRQSRANAARARQARATADSLHRVAIAWQTRSEAAADSLRALADARLTIIALVGETASLRVAVAQSDSALEAQTAAHVAADRRADAVERRNAALESLNARLARDLRDASPKCRIAWVLRCPSRTEAYAAGLLTPSAVRVARNLATGRPPLQGVF